MRICFFIYNFSRSGGSERVTSIIANYLSKKNHDITVLSVSGDNTCFYPLESDILLHTLFDYPINCKSGFFSILHKLHSFYKKNRFDLVIDVFASMSIFTLILKPVFKFKNISWEHFNYTANIGMSFWGRKLAVLFSDEIITLTKEDQEAYCTKEKFKRAKISYINNPTPYENPQKSQLNRKNMITVGRLTYQKGYDMLLDAWHLVEKKHKDWNLLIFGTGEDEKKLKEQAKKLHLEKLVFKGVSKDIDKCYRNASVYVSSSRFEGLPMCMIEANSFGLPIVSFNYKTGPEEIISDGVNGYLVKEGDIVGLANKLLYIMDNPSCIQELSKSIKIDRFTMKYIGQRWDEELNYLMGKKKGK